LIVFAKTPRLGFAKTRLARDIGVTHARRIARDLGSRTARLALDGRWRTIWTVAPDRDAALMLQGVWPAEGAALRFPQGAGDLGERLIRAMMTAVPGPVALIGTDAPAVNRAMMAEVWKGLKGADAVIGLAEDGGFWVLALSHRARRASVLENVRWSHPQTAADVLANLKGARVRHAPTLADVDDLESMRSAGYRPGRPMKNQANPRLRKRA
jgi:uncharacterized protein